MIHSTLEGWRMRRRPLDRRLGPRRALIVGSTPRALGAARELAASGCVQVIVSASTRGEAQRAEGRIESAARVVVGLEEAAPANVLILAGEGDAGEAALWAARRSPEAVLVIPAIDGAAACAGALRRSGLPPWSILAPGGMPFASAERVRLARRTGLDASQIAVPVIGGHRAGWRPLARYVAIAGIPPGESCLSGRAEGHEAGPDQATEQDDLVSAAIDLARAVLQDRREIFSCCAWVDGFFGIAGAFVTLPVPIGTRGAEDPLPLRLSVEERALLQRAASD